jgi:Co/Zn/Cd efflux system component
LPKIALTVGALLIVVGGWAYTASGPGASPTALIPALLGLLLVVAGVVALRGRDTRRHAMHAAAGVALSGVLGSLGQLIASPAAGSADADIARTAGLLNLVLCGAFLVLAVRSFVQARRSRV